MNTRELRKFRKTFQKLKIKFVNFHFTQSEMRLPFPFMCFGGLFLAESEQNRRFAYVQPQIKRFKALFFFK